MKRTRTTLTYAFACLLAAIITALAPALPANAAPPAANDIGVQQSCIGVTGGAEANPNVTGRQTVRSINSYRGTIQVRSGYFGGVRYGWTRVIDPNPVWGAVLKIDLNGDRIEDTACGDDGRFSGVSYMFPTSSSPNRAFKACILVTSDLNTPCTPQYQTTWW